MNILEEIKEYVIECPKFYGIDMTETNDYFGYRLTCSDGHYWQVTVERMRKDNISEKQLRRFAEGATMMSHIIRSDNADKEEIMERLMHPILSLGFEDV
jgi:hypothetical protein